MKKLIFWSLLFAFRLSAQSDPDNWMVSFGTSAGFEAGSQYFTLVSDANLRDKPGTSSNVLTKLPIGTPVTIETVTTDSFTLRGVKLPWLKVGCSVGGRTWSGYVWGGFMALASIQTPDIDNMQNRGVLYLTGVAAYDDKKHELTVQVRAAKAGVELSKTEFTTNGDLWYYPEFELRFEPFKKVKAVLFVNYYYPACGYPSGNNLIFWLENDKMMKVLETSSVSEAGLFYSSEDCLMPTDKGGIGEHILVVKDEAEFDENSDDFVMTKQEIALTLYKWNGTKLTKVRELK